MSKQISFFIVILIVLIINIKSECLLKLAKTQSDLYHGTSIFESGNIDSNWKEDSLELYKSEYYNSIDFFYLMELKNVSPHEDTIVSYLNIN